jgi:hypothetical protein
MHAIIPLTVVPFQVAFWKFDEHRTVLKYDAWIPNLNDWIEACMGISISNPQVEMQTIQQTLRCHPAEVHRVKYSVD